jgi:hypothetical protein
MSDSSLSQDQELPALGREYPPAGESALIDALRALHLQVHQVQPGPDRRGEHPKQHAGLWAQFEVRRDIPPELRAGLFATSGRYTALVRFSNGRSIDDTKPDVHGMAVKVLVPNEGGTARQQDFITADHPIFFARDVQHIFDFLKATATGTPPAQLATTTHPKLIGYTSVAKSSLLDLSYWSQTPYKLGDGAVKYFLQPSGDEESPSVPLNQAPDGLRDALAEQLTFRKLGRRFDLCVIPQADAVAFPIEDATIEWTSPAMRVAVIWIYPQKFDLPEQMAFFENLSWNPWNALPEHAPLGGINRARRPIYEESSALRHKTTGVATVVPTGRESF